VPKRPKKEKKKRIKGKGDLREYYDLVKGKVLLEFNLLEGERRARGQATYVFKVKPEEEVKETLTRLREEDTYSKMQVDIRFHAKQMQIEKVGIMRAGQVERVKHEYPQKEQVSFQ
jgi:ribosomal protein L19